MTFNVKKKKKETKKTQKKYIFIKRYINPT